MDITEVEGICSDGGGTFPLAKEGAIGSDEGEKVLKGTESIDGELKLPNSIK